MDAIYLDDGLLRPMGLSEPISPIAQVVSTDSQYPAVIEVADLGDSGTKLVGEHAEDYAGSAGQSAGDINGDGIDDLVVSAPFNDKFADGGGAVYVIYGGREAMPAMLDLGALTRDQGFTLYGHTAGQILGGAVGSAGDVNGDGVDDLFIGRGSDSAGHAGGAVIFGRADGFAANLNPDTLDGVDGFRVISGETGDYGYLRSSVGDINGDGFADIAVGAPAAAPNGYRSGSAYVIFGHAGGFDAELDVQALDGHDGFRIDGTEINAMLGGGVAAAGDFNGDGIDDLLVGAGHANGVNPPPGSAYLIYGTRDGFPAEMTPLDIDGANGFRMVGEHIADGAGETLGAAGDINGDGYADIVVAAWDVDYIVFGHAGANPALFHLSDLNGTNGFKLTGPEDAQFGDTVASAGDVNGDGFDDLIVGAPVGKQTHWVGHAYVVFGKAGGFDATIDVSTLDGTNGFAIDGARNRGFLGLSVGSAGDINNDGLDDIVVGAPRDGEDGSRTGASYIIYGRLPDEAVDRTGTLASQTLVGGNFDDKLAGLGGDDALWGHDGHDKLFGSSGDDTLVGGGGKDLLSGGAGADLFRFLDLLDSPGGKATDLIRDLGPGDRIDLSAIDANATLDGDQAFRLTPRFALAGDLKIHYKAAHGLTVLQGDVDGDGHADFTVKITGDHHDFADFVL